MGVGEGETLSRYFGWKMDLMNLGATNSHVLWVIGRGSWVQSHGSRVPGRG